ncbi:phage portal protein, partial [Clostridium butyricum]
MLDIEAVKQCYNEYQENYIHYEKIDMYYYANTDELKTSNPVQGRSKAKVVDNFFQSFVDKEALYSFGNSITYSY